ncbi:Squalene/phytoene synthase-domain-containing protein [Naematelia encephala]|uniref:Bifunctional lycopene cyclase/phytoene synthase n=1 Tax=Naematelia encephala TaxID=71784 RepID=A0A1Y2B144_9TREE|nr:Squalene/phytoene synthase-domain-containing protein [Naematelia encephala]
MLRYIQIHLYFLLPPIVLLGFLYRPLFGRRDVLKILWLSFMATIYTTPWDNFILSQMGWTYPPGSIIGRIWLIPIEEHLFFILQPILLILLHELFTHHRLLPFDLPNSLTIRTEAVIDPKEGRKDVDLKEGSEDVDLMGGRDKAVLKTEATVQTLARRPVASLVWILCMIVGAALVIEAHGLEMKIWGLELALKLGLGMRAFYMGWILLWISPVIGWLTYLGARVTKEGWWAWGIGSAWLVWVDTTGLGADRVTRRIAIRNGAWRISPETSLGLHVWQSLPLEWVNRRAIGVQVDAYMLRGLIEAEKTLRKGSKSFEVAKLAFGREMRIGLVAIYSWCRVTDNLIDDLVPANGTTHTQAKRDTLDRIRTHLIASYDKYPAQSYLDPTMDSISDMTSSTKSAFHLFSNLIPRLVPIRPFLELCQGYETDMQFPSHPIKLGDLQEDNLVNHLPIKTTDDLLRYADDVAGSIASAICFLAWSTLTTSSNPVHSHRPVRNYPSPGGAERGNRAWIVDKSREMGRALQLVNIARDIAKDATISRLYVPLASFPSASAVLDILYPASAKPVLSYKPYSIPLLDRADTLRKESEVAMEHLPRTARGGARAMASSYFEIAEQIRRRHGEVDEQGVKVSSWRRAWAAARAFWK